MNRFEYLVRRPAVWLDAVLWPVFSVTSHRMVSVLAKQGIQPKTVVDVGANIGQFSIACQKIFPGVRIFAFEPLPQSFEALNRNVAHAGNAKGYCTALGDEVGSVPFHVNSHSHSCSVLPLEERHKQAFPFARETGVVNVQISTLDRELRNESLIAPVLLKIDVQGYEFSVLNGAIETLRNVDWVVMEVSFRPLYQGEKPFEAVVNAMNERGFKFLRPIAWLEDPKNGEILQMDALFERSNAIAC